MVVYCAPVDLRPTKFCIHIKLYTNMNNAISKYMTHSVLNNYLCPFSRSHLLHTNLFRFNFCSVLFSFLVQVRGKRHLHMRYQVLERCTQSHRHVHGATYRYVAVIQHIVNICHIANSWSSINKHGNGAVARPT